MLGINEARVDPLQPTWLLQSEHSQAEARGGRIPRVHFKKKSFPIQKKVRGVETYGACQLGSKKALDCSHL